MSKGLLFSTALHGLIVVMAWVGVPFARRDVQIDSPIAVELVEIAEVTAAPPPEPEPEPAPEPEPEPEPEPAPAPEPPPEEPAPPPPPPPPPEPEPAPEPEPEQVAALPPPPRVAVPPRKPTPPQRDQFADLVSLVKDLEKEVANRPEPDPSDETEEPAETPVRTLQTADRATLSERDAIRAHIENCWRIDPGKEGISELSADISVSINPDGSVRSAVIQNTARYFTDSAFRTFADGARTAVLSCRNIPISPQRYDIFKEIVFTFTPQGRLN